MARNHPLRELYFSRLREFYRQPARIFWVYGFPTLLAICLGFALRSRPPDSLQGDLVSGPASAPVEKALRAYGVTAKASNRPGLLLRVNPADLATRRLQT